MPGAPAAIGLAVVGRGPAHPADTGCGHFRLTPCQRAVSHAWVTGVDLLATDGLSIIGTVGFFVPAAILVALVVGAVVRDRRLSAREEAAEADRRALQREEIPTPPRAD